MALNARDYKVTGQWAADASTVIPPVPLAGQAYRKTDLTATDARTGQPYDTIWESARNNQKDFEATGIAGQVSRYGIPVWTPLEDYVVGSIQLGTDEIPYRCIQDHGPGSVGPQDPTSTTGYWVTLSGYLGGVPRPLGENGTVLTVVDKEGGAVGWLAASVPRNKQVFRTSGIFTAPTTGWYLVSAYGAGAGGGGPAGIFTTQAGAAGGGAGGSGFSIIDTVFLDAGQEIPVSIGAPGTGGTQQWNGSAPNGTPGGSTTFGDSISAEGGVEGKGGYAVGPSITIKGGLGGEGEHRGSDGQQNFATAGAVAYGGKCYSSFCIDNELFGSGGAGGTATATNAGMSGSTNGESGIAGVCVVEW